MVSNQIDDLWCLVMNAASFFVLRMILVYEYGAEYHSSSNELFVGYDSTAQKSESDCNSTLLVIGKTLKAQT
ncbi:hypothetical protein TNCT_517021 [Trichonephila clavata]|uniref:Uncharacterized protein n=1 Tax=Trichonephila clavata TaxID=2740835 RepID=A0A8X6J2A5_TRICU|nr:hypothetical protein TNCT_517021 [Trichonephila clavata]